MKYAFATTSQFIISEVSPDDIDRLSNYLARLSESTRSRFGPHDFHLNGLNDFYANKQNTGYILTDLSSDLIIAYAVIRHGYVYGDFQRYQCYGINPDQYYDCTFAPSVADAWQRKGIGVLLLRYIFKEVKRKQFRRMVLWGGVQESNEQAIRFYLKQHFRQVGQFWHQGNNIDMIQIL